jgi:hypothetical protein
MTPRAQEENQSSSFRSSATFEEQVLQMQIRQVHQLPVRRKKRELVIPNAFVKFDQKASETNTEEN